MRSAAPRSTVDQRAPRGVADLLVEVGDRRLRTDRRLRHRTERARLREQGGRLLHVRILCADRLEGGVRGLDQGRDVLVLLADRTGQRAEVRDQALQVLVALCDLGRELIEVAIHRAERGEHLAEVLIAPVETLARADDQRPEILPAVRVERSEDLVEVHVRSRVGHRHHVALRVLPGALCARVEREEHVLQAGARAHQDRRVLVDRQELAVDVERHDRASVHELDLGDVADPHAGHAQRLALAGNDRLRGLELGLELERFLLEDRDPEPLLLEDVVADAGRDHDQGDDRDEVAQALADRGHHGAATPDRSVPSAWPTRSVTCVSVSS